MKTITLEQFKQKPVDNAYLWVHTGRGALLNVESVTGDWWVRAGGRSWACTPKDHLHVFDDPKQLAEMELIFQDDLNNARIYDRKQI